MLGIYHFQSRQFQNIVVIRLALSVYPNSEIILTNRGMGNAYVCVILTGLFCNAFVRIWLRLAHVWFFDLTAR